MPKHGDTRLYGLDPNVTVNDYVFGTNKDGSKNSANFSIKSIIALAKQIITGDDSAGVNPLGYKFTEGGLKNGFFKTNSANLTDISEITISKINEEELDLTPLLGLINENLADFRLEIGVSGNPNFKSLLTLSNKQDVLNSDNEVIAFSYSVTVDLSKTINNTLIEEDTYNLVFSYASSGSSYFNPDMDDNIAMANSFGGYSAGTTIGDLKAVKDLDKIIARLLFPVNKATINPNKSITLNGITTQTVEVGSSININFSIAFNKGTIKNGDGTVAGDLVGNLTEVQFRKGTTVLNTVGDGNSDIPNNEANYTLNDYIITAGSNIFNVIGTHKAGETTYTDSYGNNSTNLDTQKQAGAVTDNSNTLTGAYQYFLFRGLRDGNLDIINQPNGSQDIRNLTEKGFLPSNGNLTLNLTINAGEGAFIAYSKGNKTATLTDDATGNVIASVEKNQIIVKDAKGADVADYYEHIFNFNKNGFPSNIQLTLKLQ